MRLINYKGVVFHRVGGLDLTTRFKDEASLPVIDDGDWKSGSAAVEVVFTSGAALQTALLVREFVPRYGDVTGRRYTDANGNHKWINLPSYAVVDPAAYLNQLRFQIRSQACAWAATQGRAHQEALRLIDTGIAPELQLLLEYDFGRFQKTLSAYITGSERLGIERLPKDATSMPNQSPLPRMITAQCDIMLTQYLAERLRDLFGSADAQLIKRLTSANVVNTHVAYVALRILVEGTIWVLMDKQRRDEQNNTKVELQSSLNSVIYTFSNARQGMDYVHFEHSLTSDAVAFYEDIDVQDSQASASPAWKSLLFWLPSVEDLMTTPYEAKEIFYQGC
ncbi:hypothetical protein SPBR_05022 [Sporothrix brasiliensis 5110]|uniref:Uncharacterized protein n=1 Tax=Sporothrix brasiliensis 5110 TaxID=1398154 RepID=A0A0C2IDM2_9PEZI|nr:uncharacterized protein SPBR_05022 [Sporothrix brasiliensis 5110]KIH87366.1 hypothetical protein SPBR_05022 [Sporothrix brasiliensis 5110]